MYTYSWDTTSGTYTLGCLCLASGNGYAYSLPLPLNVLLVGTLYSYVLLRAWMLPYTLALLALRQVIHTVATHYLSTVLCSLVMSNNSYIECQISIPIISSTVSHAGSDMLHRYA